MKNLFLALSLLLAPCTLPLANAQEQIRVFKDGSSTRFTTSELTFSDNGATLSVADSTYNTAQLDSITVVHTIYVTFAGSTATVDLGHAPEVTATTDGAHVSIVSTNTTEVIWERTRNKVLTTTSPASTNVVSAHASHPYR